MVTEKMICPPPSIVSLKRREKMDGLMAVEMHRLPGAVNQAGENIEGKAGHFCRICGTECGIFDEDGFMLCKIYEIMSLRIMWDCGYLKFRGHGVR